ncbi:MAG: hypothetical protein WBR10_16415, partial [Candidatus Acidiferrum sp.]
MSEKIYSLLLRLFPSHFRKEYGEESLQLFRDRARDEKGFTPRLRLWLDLLADLAISVPREYFYAEPELVTASGPCQSSAPSFYFMCNERPRPGALALGSVFSLAALATFSALLSQGGIRHSRSASVRQFSERPVAPAAGVRNSRAAGENETLASSSSDLVDSAGSTQPAANETGTAVATAVAHGNLDAAERQRVLDSAIANLKHHYVYPDSAQKMAETLLANEKRGAYDAITDGDLFAHQLTKQMRHVSHDMHLELVYSQDPLPPQPAEEQ